MTPIKDKKYLITTDNWFFAPDGKQYRAVFGTVKGVLNDKDTLGIKTNRHSSDWYISIGNMYIAGCQVHYCIQTDDVSLEAPLRTCEFEGKLHKNKAENTDIYNADQ